MAAPCQVRDNPWIESWYIPTRTYSPTTGKTHFAIEFILAYEQLYGTPLRKIVIIYEYLQDHYKRLKDRYGSKVLLYEQFSGDILSKSVLGDPSDGYAILLIDDKAHAIASTPELASVFIGGTHHLLLNTMVSGTVECVY